MTGPGATEAAAAAPSWVEGEVRRLLAGMPDGPQAGLRAPADAYLDCLAGCRGGDLGAGHDRCRGAMLRGAEAAGLEGEARRRLELGLEAIEAEIAARI